MAHGITVRLNNIRNTVRQERLSKNVGPNREQRRHFKTGVGGALFGKTRFMPKDLQEPAVNVPYVNPARDEKRGRRLVAKGN